MAWPLCAGWRRHSRLKRGREHVFGNRLLPIGDHVEEAVLLYQETPPEELESPLAALAEVELVDSQQGFGGILNSEIECHGRRRLGCARVVVSPVRSKLIKIVRTP